ncbi:epimerase [Hyphomicrobium nitrativorans NL23]|uniref:Epimerase n=1 Tax=Hyphomicrobium nitrativorans NL23 TaxID=1029756 RepID=V5SDH2_9HYPH|nr:SDR family oxidoreductase [Hyphomicrobium nitrativorans]AHB48916.1 epimerase [Hyphomicrobium nitrativorans NL23]
MRLLVLGASGGVGSCLLEQAVARGHCVTAQTRKPDKLTSSAAVSIVVGSPTDEAFLRRHVAGHDAVVLCLGVDRIGRTTLFSESTKAVIGAMNAAGVRRLIAVTGVGAGDSKGHGGWFYNAVIYPLFTRNRYADKDRQEDIIERSNLDWTIIRPAPFAAKAGTGAWQVHTDIPDALQLTSVTRAEVASFILDSLETGRFLRQKPFIGHV